MDSENSYSIFIVIQQRILSSLGGVAIRNSYACLFVRYARAVQRIHATASQEVHTDRRRCWGSFMPREEFEAFIDFVYNFHPALQFTTYTISGYQPTQGNRQYLHFDRCKRAAKYPLLGR